MVLTSQHAFGLTLAAAFALSLALGWECRQVAAPLPTLASRQTETPRNALAAPPKPTAVQAFKVAVNNSTGFAYQRRVRLLEAAANLNREQVVAALDHEQIRRANVLDNDDRNLATEVLLARYAELDPAQATAWLVQAFRGDQLGTDWLALTLDPWLDRDGKAALSWAGGLPAGSRLRWLVVGHLIEHLTAIDPASAAQQAHALHLDPHENRAVYAELAEKDLSAACSQALQLSPAEATEALGGIMEFWGAHDGTAAYAWASQLPIGNLRQEATDSLYSAWAEHDGAVAAAFLGDHAIDLERNAKSVARTWAEHDPEAASRWCEQLPGDLSRSVLQSVSITWASHDPQAATVYAFSHQGPNHDQLVGFTLRTWAEANRADALAWVQSLPAASVPHGALAQVCEVWAESDPRSCLDFLAQQPDRKAVADAVAKVVDRWARTGPDEVWHWSRGLADTDERDKAGRAALAGISQEEPAHAAALLAQLPADQQGELPAEIASQWIRSDVAASQLWVAGLPPGEARNRAFGSLVGAWSAYDPTAAAAWIEGQPPGADRDAGVLRLVGGDSHMKPSDAIQLARSLQDPHLRSESLRMAASNWLEHDRPAASAWIVQSADFTPGERADLLSQGNDDKESNP